jgi:hypothetical protein
MTKGNQPTGVLSYREVAKALGISHALVIQLERSAIDKICKALDMESPFEPTGLHGKLLPRKKPARLK